MTATERLEKLEQGLAAYVAELRERRRAWTSRPASQVQTLVIAREIEQRFLQQVTVVPSVEIVGFGITRKPYPCLGCGATYHEGDNYCGSCGRALRMDCVACHQPIPDRVRVTVGEPVYAYGEREE
jgi:hypothetical protein